MLNGGRGAAGGREYRLGATAEAMGKVALGTGSGPSPEEEKLLGPKGRGLRRRRKTRGLRPRKPKLRKAFARGARGGGAWGGAGSG